MFGIGGSEILVILIVALLFLGPDKLPDAAKQISKTVRDLKKQGRVLQQTIENDEHIGGAIRDLKSALRGDEIAERPAVKKAVKPRIAGPAGAAATPAIAAGEPAHADAEASAEPVGDPAIAPELHEGLEPPPKPVVTLPPTAGEADPEVVDTTKPDDLAALIRPAPGTIAKSVSTPVPAATAAVDPAATKPDHEHG